jgi:hypothetical protein
VQQFAASAYCRWRDGRFRPNRFGKAALHVHLMQNISQLGICDGNVALPEYFELQ